LLIEGWTNRRMLSVFFNLILAAQLGQAASGPNVSVVSHLQCGSTQFAVLQVVNRLGDQPVFFPLSANYARGFTIHNVRMEIEDEGKWYLVGRGADIPSSGDRELRPGERFLDFYILPAQHRAATLSGPMMRLVVPYKIGSTFGQARTEGFKVSDLPTSKDLKCPVSPNASPSQN
jgi:hypothetical protein